MKHQSTLAINQRKEIDQESYDRLQKSLASAESQLSDIKSQIVALRRNEGSNLQESSSFLYLVAQELGKQEEVNRLKHEISLCVVVETIKDDNIICIGDKVTLSMYYPDDDETIEKVCVLVGGSPNPLNDEISQNSPIGAFIKGKAVGASGNVILPNGNVSTVKILSKE